MTSLTETIAALTADGEDYRIDAPEAWAQGRTLFGGITAALAYGAIMRAFDDLPPLRSAQFSFVGPASGSLRFQPTILRRGRSSVIVAADCWNEEGLAVRATFTFGAARESVIAHNHVLSLAVPAPEDCDPFHKTSKQLKGFLARFEFRLAHGARIFEKDKKPEFAVWTRLRDGDGSDQVMALLALTDALPCAAWVVFPKPAPISTMTWQIDFHAPLPRSVGWHLIRSTSESAADGYSLQDMHVFSDTGTPLISAKQVVALFI